VQIGDAKFWLIGRDPSGANGTDPYFGPIDEEREDQLNNANTNTLGVSAEHDDDFSDAIRTGRSTNGIVLAGLRLAWLPAEICGRSRPWMNSASSMVRTPAARGEDINRNGILDKNEKI